MLILKKQNFSLNQGHEQENLDVNLNQIFEKTFDKLSDYNKYVFFHLYTKGQLDKTNLFNLLDEYGYDYLSVLMDVGIVPKFDKTLLWSDEKSKEIKLFKFKNEDKWHLVNQKYPDHLFFNKFEQMMNDKGYLTIFSF